MSKLHKMGVVSSLCILCTGCQDVKQEWIMMLSNNGLAIVFAMFCMFVVTPAIGVVLWRGCTWVSTRGDKLLDRHSKWMDELVESNKRVAECMAPLVEKLDKLTESEPQWHQKKYDKLQLIHEDIKQTHSKLDEVHKTVVLKVRHG